MPRKVCLLSFNEILNESHLKAEIATFSHFERAKCQYCAGEAHGRSKLDGLFFGSSEGYILNCEALNIRIPSGVMDNSTIYDWSSHL